MTPRRTPEQLRSFRWFGPNDLRTFGQRSRLRQMGLGPEDWVGKPVVAILNTWSDINPCHLHFKVLAENVKKGVLQAGGMPLEIPVLSLAENFMKPTTMLYRNLLAMETEEVLRSHPIDAAVLLGACDKTTPALIMGALSAELPFLFVPGGPMLRGQWRDQTLGSGTDAWKYWAELRAGKITQEDWCEIEDGIARSHGHCMTMGTASTMTAITETLGLTLPGASSIPASDARHWRMAAESGRQAVENAWTDLNPSRFLGKSAFHNAIVADMAVGGSTNAIVHLVAMAGRANVKLPLEDFDTISRKTPRLADLRPAGRFLMEDFYFAGGLPSTLAQLLDLLDGDCITVNGKTLRENVADAKIWNGEVIRSRENPLSAEGGTAVLRGNLCPDGAVIKHSAMEQRFLKHRGPAVVFKNYPDLAKRLDDPSLPITADSVMVLQGAGPIGAPGMPEWGMLPLPKRLLETGVRDLLRISDARMSGTSYGACVLHVAPEAAIGGPLALVRDGDMIALDVAARTLTLEVADDELARRRAEWKPAPRHYERGYGALFLNEVTQANEGCDFRFLHSNGKPTPEPAIH
ncbi:Dihydroxy-acid dehydratase [Chthoniobacter flavus Ellin428]|uniref:Dihydroxy-acid dehydratase n=1 Tax=Chthoniobacter flavus Ellin428 TaxID=497964 RepID=B4D2K1_9BACT|nr:L-arabinonate dehydratase [Chthoniobacter flavus]EDY19441.1 Dihydroxy-acid dehydratase [Chthoniobacter flavus Ellin428]TCO90433.1 dihydroxy-acid dehydratase [Chthoniobacter flavus]